MTIYDAHRDEGEVSVLFVCMGNICRSPLAEGVFRRLVETRAPGLPVRIDSAATHAYHIGEPPDHRAQRAALARGFDISGQRARLVGRDDFECFDYILAMDEDNLQDLEDLAREAPRCRAEIALLMEYAPAMSRRGLAVPDPYYGGAEGFERVIDLAEASAGGLLETILAGRTTGVGVTRS